MIDKPGVYKLSSEEYHADPCPVASLSRSTIKDLLFRSPAHAAYNHPRLNLDYKEEVADKFDKGTAAHSLLLEGSDNIEVIEADDWRTKEAKSLRDVARKAGKTPLLKHQYEETKVMVIEAMRQIRGCPELGISSLDEDGEAELSYVWQEEKNWLRVRPDWISSDKKLILDLKFTGVDANPSQLSRQVITMGYSIQAALYSRGVKALEGIVPHFVFIFVETAEPYLCSFVGLTPSFMEMGIQQVEFGKHIWEECMNTGKWIGYPNKVCWLEPPPWALASWDGRSSKIGLGE